MLFRRHKTHPKHILRVIFSRNLSYQLPMQTYVHTKLLTCARVCVCACLWLRMQAAITERT